MCNFPYPDEIYFTSEVSDVQYETRRAAGSLWRPPVFQGYNLFYIILFLYFLDVYKLQVSLQSMKVGESSFITWFGKLLLQ
jgi:hypothetical protein